MTEKNQKNGTYRSTNSPDYTSLVCFSPCSSYNCLNKICGKDQLRSKMSWSLAVLDACCSLFTNAELYDSYVKTPEKSEHDRLIVNPERRFSFTICELLITLQETGQTEIMVLVSFYYR